MGVQHAAADRPATNSGTRISSKPGQHDQLDVGVPQRLEQTAWRSARPGSAARSDDAHRHAGRVARDRAPRAPARLQPTSDDAARESRARRRRRAAPAGWCRRPRRGPRLSTDDDALFADAARRGRPRTRPGQPGRSGVGDEDQAEAHVEDAQHLVALDAAELLEQREDRRHAARRPIRARPRRPRAGRAAGCPGCRRR